MTDRLIELLELCASTLFDIDDAGRLLVGNDESGSTQLHELTPSGARAVLTDLGEPCWGRYLPGERTVVVSADDGGTERAQLFLLYPDDPAAGLVPLVSDPAYIHALLDVRAGQVLYSTNRRNGVDFDVVLRTVSSGQEHVVWDGGGWVSAAAISPDGRHIAMQRESLQPASTQLLLADLETGDVAPISDEAVAGDWRPPRWLDGAIISSSDAGTEFHTVRRYDPSEQAWTTLLADPAADLQAWPAPNGRRLAVVRTADGADRLVVHPVSRDGAREGVEVILPGAGVITFRTELIWSPDSSDLGMTYASPVQPPEVYLWSDGAAERRTVSNPLAMTAELVRPVSHRVPTPDGEQVPVYLLRGDNADGAVVIYIHGGPEAASVRSWSPVIAGLAVAGFTVVVPNVRGSAGYGRRWISLDDVELRMDSVADLAAIHSWLPSTGGDPSRAALYGGSYGGYMVLAGLAFQPELWAAGVDLVGISSLVTFLENTSAYRRAYREREYGRLDTHRDFLEKVSPLTRIGDVRAPLFLVHGRNDPRVPLSEAEQVAAALRGRGIECELIVYPDEGHGLAKRANRLDAYPRARVFLDRHLR